MNTQPPLPVIIVTGALGVGKTTAIAQALSGKPAAERWVVILNEFTESGIDVLTIAGSANGEFDVQLVTGGCLCCVGAQDFSRTLAGFVAGPRPARLYIEPSGLGHPSAIIEELLAYQARGEVDLRCVVALVDAGRLEQLQVPGIYADQVEAADVLLLAKADQASAKQHEEFFAYAEQLYPPKRRLGVCQAGRLPDWVAQDQRIYSTPALADPDRPRFKPAPAGSGLLRADASINHVLDRHALSFEMPRSQGFDAQILQQALATAPELAGVERLKGVFRVGPEHWMLIQRVGTELSVKDSAWRRDNRVEVLSQAGVRLNQAALLAFWQRLADASLPQSQPDQR